MSDAKTMPKVEKSEAEWRKELPPMQYAVLREKATERPFSGEYEHEQRAGTYTCAGCGQTLFESDAKFDSGCGWPSFTQPAAESHVDEERDVTHGMIRTEVLCSRCNGHLGHVFEDGPGPTGLRYCINSAALKLDPKKTLPPRTPKIGFRGWNRRPGYAVLPSSVWRSLSASRPLGEARHVAWNDPHHCRDPLSAWRLERPDWRLWLWPRPFRNGARRCGFGGAPGFATSRQALKSFKSL